MKKTYIVNRNALAPNQLDPRPFNNMAWKVLLIAGIAGLIVMFLPLSGFSHSAQRTLVVFTVAAILWITNALPIAVTGLVVLLLMPVTGALTSHQIYSYFGNNAVFFVLGAFILASPVMRSGLSTRIAVTLISKFSKGPLSLLFSLFALSSIMAFFISEHAVAAMLFPITLEIVKAADCKPGNRYAFASFLAMGWGAIIGGTATLLGGARAPLALGLLESSTNQTISFFEWFIYTIPIVIIMLTIAFITIYFVGRKCEISIDAARTQLNTHHEALGKFSRREMLTCLVLGCTIVSWVLFGDDFGLDLVAIIGVIAAFALQITNWQEVEEDVPWGIFVMYGSAIALGAALRDTGAAAGLVHMIVSSGLSSALAMLVIIVLLASFLTEAMSNAAAVAVLMPVALVLAGQFHIDPRAMTIAVATAAGLTFLLPVSTPAMAIITNTQFVENNRALEWGMIPKLLSIVIILGVGWVYWPLVGLQV